MDKQLKQTTLSWIVPTIQMSTLTLKDRPTLRKRLDTFVWNRDPASSKYKPRMHNGFAVNCWVPGDWESYRARQNRAEFVRTRLVSDDQYFDFDDPVWEAESPPGRDIYTP